MGCEGREKNKENTGAGIIPGNGEGDEMMHETNQKLWCHITKIKGFALNRHLVDITATS